MKRFIFCIGLASVMTLSACSAQLMTAKPDLEKSFCAEAEIKAGGETIKGKLTRKAENYWELQVTEPFALEGLTAVMDNEGTKLSMFGYEADVDFSENAVSALRLIAEAYESAADNAGGFKEKICDGTNENGNYTVLVDEEGKPAALSIPQAKVSVQLSEWTECTDDTGENQEDILVVE